jgi:hypothetical protein
LIGAPNRHGSKPCSSPRSKSEIDRFLNFLKDIESRHVEATTGCVLAAFGEAPVRAPELPRVSAVYHAQLAAGIIRVDEDPPPISQG